MLEMNEKNRVNPDLLLFLHIPKTAGSTLHSIISRQLPKDEQLLCHNRDLITELSSEQLNKIRVLRGHFPFGYHENIPEKSYEYFTVLRDPIDRVISLYKHILRTPTHPFYERCIKQNYSLREAIESKEWIPFNNSMVRMISANAKLPFDSIDENHLQQAIQNIDQYFPIVGLQDRFDEFILELGDRYGWNMLWYRKRLVAEKIKKTVKVELNEETLASIRVHNAMDIKLYDFIRKRKEAYYKSLDKNFSRRLHRLKMVNRWIENFDNLYHSITNKS